MNRVILWCSVFAAPLAFGQQIINAPEQTVKTLKLDYEGPFLMKVVNGYGETSSPKLPSSMCQVTYEEVLRVNLSLHVPVGSTDGGDLKVVQTSTPVNRFAQRGLRSMKVDWKTVYDDITSVSELEKQTFVEKPQFDGPTVKYKVMYLSHWKDEGTAVVEGQTVRKKRPAPTVYTLYSKTESAVQGRTGDAVDALIAEIDRICDNDKNFEALKYQPKVSE